MIQKSQAGEVIRQSLTSWFGEYAERVIDRAIIERVDRVVTINASHLLQGHPGSWQEAVEYILDKCRAAGWAVEYISDQRDGDFIELS